MKNCGATREELDDALQKALDEHELPVVIDACVDKEENCYPMVPAGAALFEMVEGDE